VAKKKARRKKAEQRKPGPEVKAVTVTPAASPAGGGPDASATATPAPSASVRRRVEWHRLVLPFILMAISLSILLRGAFVGKAEQTQASATGVVPTAAPRNLVLPDEGFQTLSPPTWVAALNKVNPGDALILDVRTEGEAVSGRIAPDTHEAVNLDFYDSAFEQRLNRLDKKKTYFVYCSSGYRSGRALDLMKRLGFTRAFNLSGGITEYRRAGLPVVSHP
jgi:rhodanese-related sulfurtransferase